MIKMKEIREINPYSRNGKRDPDWLSGRVQPVTARSAEDNPALA